MRRPTVYLSGKMAGLSKEEMNEWREKAADELVEAGFKILNPVNTDFGTSVTDSEIIHSNDFQISHSDIILAELNYDQISIGTICEIVEARRQGKPVISWGTAYSIINHPHIRGRITRHFEDLENAVQYIIENYYL